MARHRSTLTPDLSGRVALVTGASSGIGRATARALAARGATVVATARREDRLRALVEECRTMAPDSSWVAGDLGERGFAQQVVAETIQGQGRLDILVNNAALPLHKSILETSVEEAERTLRVNLTACLWTILGCLPAMLRQGEGWIVNVSSFASKIVPTHEAVYVASKCGMNGLTEGLWRDLAGTGIHVALVHPGPIDTEIWSKLQRPHGFRGRLHPPELVAEAVIACIAEGRRELVVPRRDPSLFAARLLSAVAPGLLRWALARQEPVPPELVERARERARRGQPLHEESSPAPGSPPSSVEHAGERDASREGG